MGQIRVEIVGSFGPCSEKSFSAMDYGHAQCVADVIQYLANEVMPEAIANDHRCHAEGEKPKTGFGRITDMRRP